MAPMMDFQASSPRMPSSRRRMQLDVQPASICDVQRLVDIEFDAFENEYVNHVLSYRDNHNPAHLKRSVQNYAAALLQIDSGVKLSEFTGPDTAAKLFELMMLKVIDRETKDVISFTKTEFKRYTYDEWHSPGDVGHETEPRMNRDWFALNELSRRDYMGLRPHCYIGMLATQPQHQHHGAGTLLLKAVLDEADRRGIECYLEGTDLARPLYEKHGFRPLKELRFDPAAYGVVGLGVERQTIMVRGALDRSGVRREPLDWETAVKQSHADLQGGQVALISGRL